MKNTRGRGLHGGCREVRSRLQGVVSAQAETGRQIYAYRNATALQKITAHIAACHEGKVDENCNGCRELMKDL